ncbi:hypothetical protein MMC18_001832 [Xylographa bjoerkii]|nr:hypothetical protein [Xylographa bjoerkii]
MSLLRFQNLYGAHKQSELERRLKSPDEVSASPEQNPPSATSTELASSEPKIAWESQTPFGKLSITNISGAIGSPLNSLAANASCRIEACKESLGIKTFRKQEAEELIRFGILGGDQWKRAPAAQQLVRQQPSSAISGSLTFTAPTETFELVWLSSAFQALMVLVTIGGLLGPIERTAALIVDGALDGIFQDQSDVGRPYIENTLKRAVLHTYAADRSSKQGNAFDDLVLKCLQTVPDQLRRYCAQSKDEITTFQIDDTQLGQIAEWAFAGDARTLVLFDKVEALAATVVSTFFKTRRLAVVDCENQVINQLNSNISLNAVPSVTVYHGGTAQQAITILHRNNWLQPVARVESKRVSSKSRCLILSCPSETALDTCPAFLESVGVSKSDANYLIDAIKKDAIAQFARVISIGREEQWGFSHTSEENVQYFYEYGEYMSGYDWKFWLGFENPQIDRIMLNRPRGQSVELGSLTFYGYTAKAIHDRPSISALHESYMKMLYPNTISRFSDISVALGAVAGLIYGLALTCVHCQDASYLREMNVSCSLDNDLSETYSNLVTSMDSKITVPRSKCLGVLAQIWLGMAGLYIQHWPATALGISNSRGAVMSAIFAETTSLEKATTKFIVSTNVPDIMVGDKPVVACAVSPQSRVQKRGHQVDVRLATKEPYDGCWQIHCIAITGSSPPALDKDNLLVNKVSVVPVCGHVACGAKWWENVDLDNAFAVMVESAEDAMGSTCSSCPQAVEARWLEQEIFLQKTHFGFSCSLPREGGKLLVPAHGNGLMQGFLCGLFRGSAQRLRYPLHNCIEHINADIVIC